MVFLQNNSKLFDLIICVDTLVYFGDLNPIFAGVYKALPAGSVFSFSVEAGDKINYYLQPSGRFTHSQNYIELLAQEYKFSVLVIERVEGRLQAGEMINSVIYVLEKSSEVFA